MNKRKKEIMYYLIGITFSLVWCFFSLNLWNYDFSVPFWYSDGDNLLTIIWVKRLMDGFFLNSFQGAPFSALLIDFPLYGDTLNLLLLKILTIIFNNVGYIINIFYLMLFPLTFCVSFFVMRKCCIVREIALLGSILFSFLPYRFLRGTTHLFLSNYSFIPLVILFCIFFYTNKKLTKKEMYIFYFSLILLTALNGIYYAFFSCFFILLTMVMKFFEDKKLFKVPLLIILGIVMTLVISMIPTNLLTMVYGENFEAPMRSPIEAEVYGLKITQFFIPNTNYDIDVFQKLLDMYRNAPVPNEGSEYLGLIGVIGLIILFVVLFIDMKEKKELLLVSKLNLGAILLATVGGFGSIFALLVTPLIRGYNRISVFVAFFAIWTVCFLLSNFYEKAKSKKLIYISILIVFFFSLWEQTIFDNGRLKVCAESFYSDKTFVEQIEKNVSENAMIYQYPYFKFPEMPPLNNLGDYGLARGYIHSKALRWSYGDYKGRNTDLWHRELNTKPLEEQIKIISIVGFEGIYIDSFAYTKEELDNLKNELNMLLKDEKFFISQDGRLLFYGLQNYQEKILAQYTQSEIENIQDKLLLGCYYKDGFSDLETSKGMTWRWCDKTGTIIINNPEKEIKQIKYNAEIYTGYTEKADLIVKWDKEEYQYEISLDGTKIELDFRLKPGENKIKFSTNAQQINAPDDPRQLYMRFENTSIDII